MPSESRSPRLALVVDEDAALRQAVAVALAREGWEVTAVESAAQASQALGRRGVELVAAALRPLDAGLALVEEARRQRAAPTIVIAWTERPTVALAGDAIRRGAADLLAAPVRPDDVLWALRKAEARARTPAAAPPAGDAEPDSPLGRLVATSTAMTAVLRDVRRVAAFRTTVLITGESGTGKEMIARVLHDASPRRTAPFVAVNCAAIPESLLESELFGHRRGAFTDAVRDRAGLFETASGGTLLLDEIGELPLGLQVKLLRALQEQEIRPLGATADVKVDVRVIAATVRDLAADVAAGRFREDLFYRLNVVGIALPPLRERREEIPGLVERFIARTNRKLGTAIAGISDEALRLLGEYAWPGNVRELENTVERAMVLAEGDRIEAAALPERVRSARERPRPEARAGEAPSAPQARGASRGNSEAGWEGGGPKAGPIMGGEAGGDLSIKRATRQIEASLIRRALQETRGNRTNAAKLLEISHRALLYKIKEYGISDG